MAIGLTASCIAELTTGECNSAREGVSSYERCADLHEKYTQRKISPFFLNKAIKITNAIDMYRDLSLKGYAACAAVDSGVSIDVLSEKFLEDVRDKMFFEGRPDKSADFILQTSTALIELKTLRRDAADPDKAETASSVNEHARRVMDDALAKGDFVLYAACAMGIEDSNREVLSAVRGRVEFDASEVEDRGEGPSPIPGSPAEAPPGGQSISARDHMAETEPTAVGGGSLSKGQRKRAQQKRAAERRRAQAASAAEGALGGVEQGATAAPLPPEPPSEVSSRKGPLVGAGEKEAKPSSLPIADVPAPPTAAPEHDAPADAKGEGRLPEPGKENLQDDVGAHLEELAALNRVLAAGGEDRDDFRTVRGKRNKAVQKTIEESLKTQTQRSRIAELLAARSTGASVKAMNVTMLMYSGFGSEQKIYERDWRSTGAFWEFTTADGKGRYRNGKPTSKIDSFKRAMDPRNNPHGLPYVLYAPHYKNQAGIDYITSNGGVFIKSEADAEAVAFFLDNRWRAGQGSAGF